MGKLIVEGFGQKEYAYDGMKITVRFQTYAATSRQAVTTVVEQCEQFLTIVKNEKIKLTHIKNGETKIEQFYFDNAFQVTAIREVTFQLPYNGEVSNLFMAIIKNYNYDANLYIEPFIMNTAAVNDELLMLAIADSKRKANLIAKSMQQNITEVISIHVKNQLLNQWHKYDLNVEQFYETENMQQTHAGNSLHAPTVIESVSIEVIWEMTP